MNPSTMNHSRRILTPGASNKRKERESLVDSLKPSTATKIAKPNVPLPLPRPITPTASNNQLLAGYLAHEFLTKGTLFGQPWDLARAEAVPVSSASAELRRMKSFSQKAKGETRVKSSHEGGQAVDEKYERYVEVADLLKRDGVHLPGIVNPTQLARFLQL